MKTIAWLEYIQYNFHILTDSHVSLYYFDYGYLLSIYLIFETIFNSIVHWHFNAGSSANLKSSFLFMQNALRIVLIQKIILHSTDSICFQKNFNSLGLFTVGSSLTQIFLLCNKDNNSNFTSSFVVCICNWWNASLYLHCWYGRAKK